MRGCDTNGYYIIEDELGFNRTSKEEDLTPVYGDNYDTRSEFQKNAQGEHISIGMNVRFLKEKGSGLVKEIKAKGKIIIEDETGFDREMFVQDVTPVILDKIPTIEISIPKEFDGTSNSVKKSVQKTGKHKAGDVWTIDLHAEVLFESHAGLSNREILLKQLAEFKTFYLNALEKNIRKIIVIHGVGQGVLKDEVRYFLSGKSGVEFYDADFVKYGRGATEVRIRYNF